MVGSVAYDTVETPFGRAEKVLGGSASFFSVAASFFAPVMLVAVVGEDFGEEQVQVFEGRGIDLEGLERAKGKTFHWAGRYSYDLNAAGDALHRAQRLRELRAQDPARPIATSEFVFLGNIDPELQRDVLEQVEHPQLVACDTMNFWIEGKLEELKKTLERSTSCSSTTPRRASSRASGTWSRPRAPCGPWARGPWWSRRASTESLMFSEAGSFAAPAYLLEEVFDPTGAGDTFAGGFLGYLARAPATRRGDAAPRRGHGQHAGLVLRSRPSASTAC